MDTENTPFVPYYIEMVNIWNRIGVLSRTQYPHYRTHYLPDGSFVTEEVPEYLEQQSLIARWNSLHRYEEALAGTKCKNELLVSIKLDLLADGLAGEKYDPAVAHRIAISVYKNSLA